MEFAQLPKEVVDINNLLINHFGIDTDTGKPMWRVAWSNDQYEKRMTSYTDNGVALLYPEVRLLPKYQWIDKKWILERLVLVPQAHEEELAGLKQSYECMYAFDIMPSFEACKFIVDVVYAALGKQTMKRYIDDEEANPIEAKETRLKKLEEELFGDESSLLGRTITGEAVGYTGQPKIDQSKDNGE